MHVWWVVGGRNWSQEGQDVSLGVQNCGWGLECVNTLEGGSWWSKQVDGGLQKVVEVQDTWWRFKRCGWGFEMSGGG